MDYKARMAAARHEVLHGLLAYQVGYEVDEVRIGESNHTSVRLPFVPGCIKYAYRKDPEATRENVVFTLAALIAPHVLLGQPLSAADNDLRFGLNIAKLSYAATCRVPAGAKLHTYFWPLRSSREDASGV